MKCPHCSTELKLSDRNGVEIDYCGTCRGVWLDRGELDKIIERASNGAAARDWDDDDADARRLPPPIPGERDASRHTQRKKTWLGDIFDFGD